ncbi:neuropilin-2a isoform X1 [Tachysurus ichikawai]
MGRQLVAKGQRYDFIEIRDGSSDSADLLGRHCSNIAPPAIMSSGPVVHIKFVSDYAHQGAGFSLRYEILKTGHKTSGPQHASQAQCYTSA